MIGFLKIMLLLKKFRTVSSIVYHWVNDSHAIKEKKTRVTQNFLCSQYNKKNQRFLHQTTYSLSKNLYKCVPLYTRMLSITRDDKHHPLLVTDQNILIKWRFSSQRWLAYSSTSFVELMISVFWVCTVAYSSDTVETLSVVPSSFPPPLSISAGATEWICGELRADWGLGAFRVRLA